MTDAAQEKAPATAQEAVSAAEPPEETKSCVQCGDPAVYTSPSGGAFEVASFCGKHKPVNAPKK